MSETTLKIISEAMDSLGLSYAFMEAPSNPGETYYTGEYTEQTPMNEDGLQETTFLITGHSREGYSVLEKDKQKIKSYFPKVGGKTVIAEGSAVAIFYSHSFPVRTVDAEIKKIQINLDVKEWSVK